ncbi:hypothetical protein M3Y94_01005500 [Aphelenchoides besseyi]|nr:hypothetical protein M3Y94_01005500 [Aphelenchoides besseyi]KAI6220434.1 hypothetical protein M3Y95_01039600 [Aphelenchoides besseyi]
MTKDTCACRTHVHTGTFIIGILSAIFTIIQLARTLLNYASGEELTQNIVPKDNHTNNINMTSLFNNAPKNLPHVNEATLVLNCMSLSFSILLIVGVRRKVRALYYPFIVWTVITTILSTLILVIMTFGFVVVFVFASTKSGTGIYILVAVLVFIFVSLSILVQFYFFYIVPKRSLDLLTEEQQMSISNGQQKQNFEYSNRV